MSEMLSRYFSRAEFEHSDTAIARRLPNVMGPDAMRAAGALCVNILDPIREAFGRPVTLNSGYRAPAVNRAVGSGSTSQHPKGEAADFEIEGMTNLALATWVRDSGLAFDQLILEAYRPGVPGSGWVHVSRKLAGRQRGQVLTMTLGSHGAVYSQGIVG